VVVLRVRAPEAKRQPTAITTQVFTAVLDGEVAEYPPPSPRDEDHLPVTLEHEPALAVAAVLPARPRLGPHCSFHDHEQVTFGLVRCNVLSPGIGAGLKTL
jgi:hypothetical protein